MPPEAAGSPHHRWYSEAVRSPLAGLWNRLAAKQDISMWTGKLKFPNPYNSLRALTTYRAELVIAKQKVSSKLLSSYGRKNSLWMSISSSYLWNFFTINFFKFAAQITKKDMPVTHKVFR